MRLSHLVAYTICLAGLLLLGGMVWQVGVANLLTTFHAVGLWIVPWILIEIIPILLHTVAWVPCFHSRRGTVQFWDLFAVRLAGSAINQVTPTVSIGGEVVKVMLLESTLPRAQAAASVVIDKASTTLAQILHLIIGIAYLAGRLPLPDGVQLGMGITLGLMSLGLVGFIAVQRYGLLSKCIGWLSGFNIGLARLQRLSEHLRPLEASMAAYYIAHPWRFVLSVSLHGMAIAFTHIQNFLALRLLLGADAPSLADTIMLTVAMSALDQTMFFVPGGLGTFEGIRFTILSTFGLAQVYGLAFGLMARLENLSWNGLGLLVYVWYTRTARYRQPVSQVPSAPSPAPPTA